MDQYSCRIQKREKVESIITTPCVAYAITTSQRQRLFEADYAEIPGISVVDTPSTTAAEVSGDQEHVYDYVIPGDAIKTLVSS